MLTAGSDTTEESNMKYPSPPIIESVIEIRFETPLSFDKIETRASSFKRNYQHRDDNLLIKTTYSPEGLKAQSDKVGYRFRTESQLEILDINTDKIIVAQLAPYPGWEVFSARFFRDYSAFEKNFGKRAPSRIGVRFVNRIDVVEPVLRPDKYLNLYPKIPNLQDSTGIGFVVQESRRLGDGLHDVNMRSSIVESPLPNHVGLMLDIDLYLEKDLPRNLAQLEDQLSRMREIKNSLFESLITDESRRLFEWAH